MKYDYTPKTLDDIVFPSDHARETVDRIVNLRIPLAQSGKHGILIYGTNGTGKSTLAKMIPREIERRIEGDQYLWVTREEVGSTQESHRIMARVDTVTSTMRWPGNTYQYIILDEVDRLGPSPIYSSG